MKRVYKQKFVSTAGAIRNPEVRALINGLAMAGGVVLEWDVRDVVLFPSQNYDAGGEIAIRGWGYLCPKDKDLTWNSEAVQRVWERLAARQIWDLE